MQVREIHVSSIALRSLVQQPVVHHASTRAGLAQSIAGHTAIKVSEPTQSMH